MAVPRVVWAGPSDELGLEVADQLGVACATERPVIVAVRESGSLADWFEAADFTASLSSRLHNGSVASKSAYRRYIDTDNDEAIRQTLANEHGGLFIAEISPAEERVDVYVSGHCFSPPRRERKIEAFLVQREPASDEQVVAASTHADATARLGIPSEDSTTSSLSTTSSTPRPDSGQRPVPALQLGVFWPGTQTAGATAVRVSVRHPLRPAWSLMERVELQPDSEPSDLTHRLVGIAHEGAPSIDFQLPIVRPVTVFGAAVDREWGRTDGPVAVSPHLRAGPAIAIVQTRYATYDDSQEGFSTHATAVSEGESSMRVAALFEGATEVHKEGRLGLSLTIGTLAWLAPVPKYSPDQDSDERQLVALYRLGLDLHIDLGTAR